MSVYIHGFEMPKSCNECRFFVDAWCYALEADDWRNAYNKPQEGKRLENCDGYTDWTTRLIVVEQEIEGDLGDMRRYAAKVARHEIVHAFLVESGLSTSSGCYDSWATNEEMVDWISRIGPRIYHAWDTAKVLLPEDFGG